MKHPKLKFRYAEGLGDIVACILHCKLIGWLTKIITKSDVPCKTCSVRSFALNILVPIPLWKLFFKDKEAFLNSLKNDGVNINKISHQKQDDQIKLPSQKPILPKIENDPSDYKLYSRSDSQLGDYLVRTLTYVKK